MLELQIFLQRRRKLLVRLTAVLAVVVAGVLLVLPRAGAHDNSPPVRTADLGDKRILLSPASLASAEFGTFYGPVHR
jgi:hypothetical protein